MRKLSFRHTLIDMKCLVIVCCVSTAVAGDEKTGKITTADSAIAKSLAYTHVHEFGAFSQAKKTTTMGHVSQMSIAAVMDTVRGDRTPFIHSLIEDKLLWRVTYRGISLSTDDTTLRDCEALVDPETGAFLGAFFNSRSNSGALLPLTSSDAAEKELRGMGESYTLTTAIPSVSLFEAISRNIAGEAGLSQEMSAICVEHSNMQWKERLVWVFILRGLPPEPTIGFRKRKAPAWQRTQTRISIDANTGLELMRTNYPHSERPPEEK